MAGAFDDLIPGASPGAGGFDDLIPAKPKGPTIGESLGGTGLSLLSGAMRATKIPSDIVETVAPNPVTRSIGDFFQRGIDAAADLQPDSVKTALAQPILSRDESGGIDFQMPNTSQIVNTLAESAPQIPALLAGGGALSAGARALGAGKTVAQALGYGGANALAVGPSAGIDVRDEALAGGATEDEARSAQLTAAGLMTPISAVTGAAGLGLAARLGAGKGVVSGAVRGLAADAPFEAVEEGAQSVVSDVALKRDIDPLKAGSAATLGAIAGGLPGAAVGAVEGAVNQAVPAKPAGPLVRAALAAPSIAPGTPDPQAAANEQRAAMEADEASVVRDDARADEVERRQRFMDASNMVVGEGGQNITLERPKGVTPIEDERVPVDGIEVGEGDSITLQTPGVADPDPLTGIEVGEVKPEAITLSSEAQDPGKPKKGSVSVGTEQLSELSPQERAAYEETLARRAAEAPPVAEPIFKTAPAARAALRKLTNASEFEVRPIGKGQFELARKSDGEQKPAPEVAAASDGRPGDNAQGSPADSPVVAGGAADGAAVRDARGIGAGDAAPAPVGVPQPQSDVALTEKADGPATEGGIPDPAPAPSAAGVRPADVAGAPAAGLPESAGPQPGGEPGAVASPAPAIRRDDGSPFPTVVAANQARAKLAEKASYRVSATGDGGFEVRRNDAAELERLEREHATLRAEIERVGTGTTSATGSFQPTAVQTNLANRANWVRRELQRVRVAVGNPQPSVQTIATTKTTTTPAAAADAASATNTENPQSLGTSSERVEETAVSGQEPVAVNVDRNIPENIPEAPEGWSRFERDSGTLNIPRADMPQIKAEHRGALVQFLKGKGIEHATEEVDPKSLKPTQSEFSPAKVAKAKKFEGGDRSILVSSDGHVVDGHHQWLAKRDAGEPIKVIRLDKPIAELLPTVKEFPSAGASDGASPAAVRSAASRPRKLKAVKAPTTAAGLADMHRRDLLKAIADRGGIDRSEMADITGEGRRDKATGKVRTKAGGLILKLFRPGGMRIDDVREMLVDLGHFDPETADVAGDANEVRALIRAALDGDSAATVPVHARDIYEEMRTEERLADEAAAEQYQLTQIEAERATIQREADDLLSEDERDDLARQYSDDHTYFLKLQEAVDAKREQIAGDGGGETRTGASGKESEVPGAEAAGARADEQSAGAQGAEPGEVEPPLLASYSEDDLAARADRKRAAETAGEREDLEAQRRAKADTEAKDFRLTGSDRPADVAIAGGQNQLFGASGESRTPSAPEADAASDVGSAPDREGAIGDFGEKIGGARKDTAAQTGPKKSKRGSEEPAIARRFNISQIAASSTESEVGKWSLTDKQKTDWMGQPRQLGAFETKEKAEQARVLAALGLKHRVVSRTDGDRTFFEIVRDVTDRKRVTVVGEQFPTREDAMRHMVANAQDILDTKTSFGEEILPLPKEVKRKGADRRDRNADAKMFSDTFGFRGVEFGLWNDQDERQQVMNHAYDALLDLSETIGIPPQAISLNGDLALAFGARGQGLQGARAHYERDYGVINLTKMKGAGALAHEWFHALDHYFGRLDGKASSARVKNARGDSVFDAKDRSDDYLSHGPGYKSKVREEVRAAYKKLIDTMFRKAEQYVEDSRQAEKFVGQTRENVAGELARIRDYLATAQDPRYYKKKAAAATAEQLVEFDAVVERVLNGELFPDKLVQGKSTRSMRWSNDAVDKVSAIYKAVRGRSGFGSGDQRGVMDNLRTSMGFYAARLKMLADAQQGSEKTKAVPTKFAMEAKALDQGRASEYWMTPHEMAARAFQSFVEDRLEGTQNLNNFLSYGTHGGVLTPWGVNYPYPEGAERVAINDAFGKLFDVIQSQKTDNGTALFSLSAPIGDGMTRAEADAAVTSLTKNWGNAPPIIVLDSMKDSRVPETARRSYEQRLAGGATGVPKGFIMPDGRIYIVAGQHLNAASIVRTTLHEAAGHFGLRGTFGTELASILDQVATLRKADVDRKIAQYGFSDSLTDRRRAAEEVLAEMAESNPQAGFVKRAVAAIRAFLRRLGVPMQLTDADIISEFLIPARQFVESGGARSPLTEGAPIAASLPPARRGNTGVEGVWGLPSKLSEGATHVAVRITDQGRRFFYGDSHQQARERAAAYDEGIDPGDREGVLRTSQRRASPDDRGTVQSSYGQGLVAAALDLVPARRLQFQGQLRAAPDLKGRCFIRSAELSARGLGDMLIGRRTQGGATYWHGVVRLPGGVIYDATADRSFKPGVYEQLGFEVEETLTPTEVANFMADHDGAFPAPHNLGLAGMEESRQGNEPDFSLGDEQPRGNAASFDAPGPSWMDDLVYSLQDKQIDLRRIQQAITKTGQRIGDEVDPYLQEELFYGRAAKQTQDFIDSELKPLLKNMAARGVSMADLEGFLHARHAPEANRVLAERNPGAADGLAGMTTADAESYLAGLDPARRAALEEVASQVDQIIRESRQVLVGYGLESQETVDAWADTYQHYVPLMREDMEGTPGTGNGFSVRGASSKARTGSQRQVVDILANVAMQRERAIVRGEKNRVANALIGMAETFPNPELWKVDTPPMERVLDERTGLVVSRIDPLYKSRDNVIVARVPTEDGIRERVLVLDEANPRAVRMAQAMKNLDMDQLGKVLGASAKVTRYLASVNTQYNPVFGIVNLVRDVQGALFNLSTTPIAGKQGAVAANLLSALKGIYSDARRVRAGGEAKSEWSQEWEEFQKVGGQTGYRDMFRTSKDRAEAIGDELKRAAKGDPLKAGRAVFDWLSDYNLAMENAVRLSAYRVGKQQGMSAERAASLAKNLTVNFNRKGQVAQQAGALYAFFNASAQGTARLAETLAGPAGKRILIGGLTLGVMQALALSAAGFDDEEPPEFVRERSLIIPVGGEKYLTIPMPLGLHVIPSTGRILTEFALSGFENGSRRTADLVGLFADAFNPIGNAGLSLQTIAPTVVDPFAALSENKDFSGRTIYREDFNKLAPTPGFTRASDTSTWISGVLSKTLNMLSGGSEFTPGVVSPSPDAIDYLLEQATGGVGREYNKAEQTVTAALTGEELPPFKVPLLGRFFGDSSGQASEAGAFYRNVRRINSHEAEIKGRIEQRRSPAEYIAANPDARLVRMANAAERRVRELRAAKRAAVDRSAPATAVRQIEAQITAQMKMFNDRAKALREAA